MSGNKIKQHLDLLLLTLFATRNDNEQKFNQLLTERQQFISYRIVQIQIQFVLKCTSLIQIAIKLKRKLLRFLSIQHEYVRNRCSYLIRLNH